MAAKITIRPPPHVEYVQNYPGIPGVQTPPATSFATAVDARGPAYAAGAIELRPGPKPLYARLLQLELRKVETLPGGIRLTELIGLKPTELWSADDEPAGPAQATAGRGWAQLGVRDFSFKIAIPEGLPPSVVIDPKSDVGVRYELCATLFVRPKPKSKGLFHRSKDGGDSDGHDQLEPVPIYASESLRIVKHDLHSAWPIYHPDPPETKEVEKSGVTVGVTRNVTAVGPGDELWTRVKLVSEQVRGIKIIRFEISLREILMFRYPSPSGAASSGVGKDAGMRKDQRVNTIFDVHAKLGKQLYHKEQHAFDIKSLVPAHSTSINGSSSQRLTVSTAKHLSIEYLLRVRAVVEGIEGGEIVVDYLPVTMGDRGLREAQNTIDRIGPVDRLMRGPRSALKSAENRPPAGALANQKRFSHQPGSSGGGARVQIAPSQSPPLPGPGVFNATAQTDILSAARGRQSMPPAVRTSGGETRDRGQHRHTTFADSSARTTTVRFTAGQEARGGSDAGDHHDSRQRPVSSYAHKGDGVVVDYGSQRSTIHPLELGRTPDSSPSLVRGRTTTRPIDGPPSSASIAEKLRESKARIASGSAAASINSSRSAQSSQNPSPERKYTTAEEEKKRLFDEAKREAERMQGMAKSTSTAMNGTAPGGQAQGGTTSAGGDGSGKYLTAEQEKSKLFEEAKRTAEETQRRAAGGQPQSQRDEGQGGSTEVGAGSSRYPTAEEEKKRLFEEARRTAEETQRLAAGGQRAERSTSDATIRPSTATKSGKARQFESAVDEKKRYEDARRKQEEAEERARSFYASQGHGSPTGSAGNHYPAREASVSYPNSPQMQTGRLSLQGSPDRAFQQPPLPAQTPAVEIDPHREAYLRAIAQREAFVAAKTGSPVLGPQHAGRWKSALEEKERLRQEIGSNGVVTSPTADVYQPRQEDSRRQSTRMSAAYLDRSYSNSSAASSSAGTAQYHRDPEIKAGKAKAVEPPPTSPMEYGSPGGTIYSSGPHPAPLRTVSTESTGNLAYLPSHRASTPFDMGQMMNGVGMVWTGSQESDRSGTGTGTGTRSPPPPRPPKIPLQ